MPAEAAETRTGRRSLDWDAIRDAQAARTAHRIYLQRMRALLPLATDAARRRAQAVLEAGDGGPRSVDDTTKTDVARMVEQLRRVEDSLADLEANLKPLPDHFRPRCGARLPDGGRCEVLAELDHTGARVRNGRCAGHGGRSTGPRTAEGRQRCAAAASRRHEETRIAWAMERERVIRNQAGKEDMT